MRRDPPSVRLVSRRLPPQHPLEAVRLSRLKQLAVLSGARDDRLDTLVEATARLLGFPIAFLSVVGESQQVVRAAYGTELAHSLREEAVCAWTVAAGETLAVGDLHGDARFADNPVLRVAGLRSYIGAPLLSRGLPVGTLCVADVQPRDVGAVDVGLLERMAAVAVVQLEAAKAPRAAERSTPSSARRIRAALARGDVEPRYLPIVRLEDSGVHEVEAVLGWRAGTADPARLSAGDDLELAQELERELLLQACGHAAAWRRALPAAFELRVGVDVSGRLLEAGRVQDLVDGALAGTGLEPSALVLELSELVVVNATDRVLRAVEKLREAGVGIALDDFGRGYASLSQLQRLPLTQLKVAGDLIADVGDSSTGDAVAEAVLRVGERQGIEVVAAGVADHRQAQDLRRLGFTYAQGPCFSPPCDRAAFEAMLLSRSTEASFDLWAAVLERRRSSSPA